MKVVLQRVSSASVRVDGQIVGQIGPGLLLLVGIAAGDGAEALERMAAKIVNMRIFSDDQGKFNLSLLDTGGQALVVSQFTLLADTRKGRRPAFTEAARPEMAQPMVASFSAMLADLGVPHVATGRFGAMMEVDLCNQGPVTIVLES